MTGKRVKNSSACSNKINIRLSDTHQQRLNQYYEKTGADAAGVMNSLVQSYVQTMLDTGDTITPMFPDEAYTRLAPSGAGFKAERVYKKSVNFSDAPKGDIFDRLAAWLRNDAPETAKNAVILMKEAIEKQAAERAKEPSTVIQFPYNPPRRRAEERIAHE